MHAHRIWLVCIFLAECCAKPDHEVLSKIRKCFNAEWKYVGLALNLEHNLLETIESNHQKIDDRSFQMLVEWMKRDKKPCYCKLISAMEEEELQSAVHDLKQKIKSSEYYTLIHEVTPWSSALY